MAANDNQIAAHSDMIALIAKVQDAVSTAQGVKASLIAKNIPVDVADCDAVVSALSPLIPVLQKDADSILQIAAVV